ncbi:AbrB/MazE/SpoVT family DNA-binding domain-containing protein [Oceanobacillus locisalsi]|uniref:AbrB/MazE/SpoVT family DNA-binding domain-containing protein n=1 Tax=Oceanobacillus locisalsi TaxID=546107 RepID=A0ABW3NEM3_9BACI
MSTTAQKWGGSIGVRIPQKIAKKHGVENGTQINITEDGNKIILEPIKNKPTLEDLIQHCSPENSHEEIDFGGPAGRELF